MCQGLIISGRQGTGHGEIMAITGCPGHGSSRQSPASCGRLGIGTLGGDVYRWHPGYWGRRVGFYGGINYGFGYFGAGFVGGGWSGGHFRYNTAVTRVDTRIVHNVYVDRRVVVNQRSVTRVSYHGGPGGVVARAPVRGVRGPRVPMTSVQREHIAVSGQDRNQLAGVTNQRPRQVAVGHAFSSRNRPSTFEQVRPGDRVASRLHMGRDRQRNWPRGCAPRGPHAHRRAPAGHPQGDRQR